MYHYVKTIGHVRVSCNSAPAKGLWMAGFVGPGYGLRFLDRRKSYFDISGRFALYRLSICLLQRGPE